MSFNAIYIPLDHTRVTNTLPSHQAISDGLTEQSAPVIKARVLVEKLKQEAVERELEAREKALVREKELKKAQGRLDDAVAQAKTEYEEYMAITDNDKQVCKAGAISVQW